MCRKCFRIQPCGNDMFHVICACVTCIEIPIGIYDFIYYLITGKEHNYPFEVIKDTFCDSFYNNTDDTVWCCYSKNPNHKKVYCSIDHCCGKRMTPPQCPDNTVDYFCKLCCNIVACPCLPCCSLCEIIKLYRTRCDYLEWNCSCIKKNDINEENIITVQPV